MFRVAVLVLVVAACYRPATSSETCATSCTVTCPDGLDCGPDKLCHRIGEPACSDASPVLDDGSPLDGADIDSPIGRFCAGGGLMTVCFDPAPVDIAMPTSAINTSTGVGCALVNDEAGKPVCVIAGGSVRVGAAAMLGVTGDRPLVVWAMTTLVVDGTIDVASHRGFQRGPSANTPCMGPSTTAPHFGGAGGSFNGTGGIGAPGDSMAGQTQPAAGSASLTEVRGGCPGGAGGTGAGTLGGAPGDGGGIVYLMAREMIEVSGTINASGAGAGIASFGAAGGGGGGSGGLIVLDAPVITIRSTAAIFAVGGGGSSGGGSTQVGTPGDEVFTMRHAFSADGPQMAGDGGGTLMNGGAGLLGGGGGGGGGAYGFIYAFPAGHSLDQTRFLPDYL